MALQEVGRIRNALGAELIVEVSEGDGSVGLKLLDGGYYSKLLAGGYYSLSSRSRGLAEQLRDLLTKALETRPERCCEERRVGKRRAQEQPGYVGRREVSDDRRSSLGRGNNRRHSDGRRAGERRRGVLANMGLRGAELGCR